MSTQSSAVKQVTVYEQFLNEESRVSFHFFQDKITKETKWRDLTGPEKIKLFFKISIQKVQDWLFQYVPNSSINWKNITCDISKSCYRLVETIYQTKHITPYIHLLVSHISEFLAVHGTIAVFYEQGLEKLNDNVTKNYFRSTNHRDKECLKQIILKLNRLEELEDNGYGRQKLSDVCRICKQIGHNAKTCKQKI